MRASTLFSIAICALAMSCSYAETPVTQANAEHRIKIAIGNFTFVPNAMTVMTGTTIEWVNEDDVPHIVIGTDANSPIKSPPLDTNDRYSLVVTKPGTYKYFCSIHPHMVGTLIVN